MFRSFLKYWLAVLVWMAVIFCASSDAGSFQHSSRIVAPFLLWLFPHLSAEAIHATVVFVRKCGHLTEYAILGLLVWRALRKPKRNQPRPWDWPLATRAILLVTLYAASDEFHQAFVPTRQASVVDVLIDTAGATVGLLFLWGIGRWREQRTAVSKSKGRPGGAS